MIEKIIEFISKIKGIEDVILLKEEQKNEIMKIEEKAEKSMLMGLMPGINQGVREAISRKFTIAAITNNDFEWPEKGTVKFVFEGKIIGEDVRGKELEKLKKEGKKIIGDVFVLYDEKNLRKAKLIVSPLELPWIKEIPYAKNVVIGSPSPPTDLYIKKIMNKDGEGKGTILIGFEKE
jgi:DNA polymerase sigma